MVKIEDPPPRRQAKPLVLDFSEGSKRLRIYCPETYGTAPCSFRSQGGARGRFDHHLPEPDDTRAIHCSAESLAGCNVECFDPNTGVVLQGRRLGFLRTVHYLKLIALRGILDAQHPQLGRPYSIQPHQRHRQPQFVFAGSGKRIEEILKLSGTDGDCLNGRILSQANQSVERLPFKGKPSPLSPAGCNRKEKEACHIEQIAFASGTSWLALAEVLLHVGLHQVGAVARRRPARQGRQNAGHSWGDVPLPCGALHFPAADSTLPIPGTPPTAIPGDPETPRGPRRATRGPWPWGVSGLPFVLGWC